MPLNPYRCFFITPMGSSDSKIRNNSDLVMNVFLRPALSQCGFAQENVVRSDHLSGDSIMADMMEHLTNDELCIADLSDNSGDPNYNVMFEAGYRKGVGKPLIYIAPVGFTKPFDISTDRIILYDFSSPDAFQKLPDSLKQLQERVQTFIAEGFFTKSGSGSVADIAKRLAEIEKKLNNALANSAHSVTPIAESDDVTSLIHDLGSPIQAFNYALQGRNVQLAESLLPRLSVMLSKERYIDAVVSQACAMGSEKAAAILKKEWDYIRENLTLEQQYEELGCFVSYCNTRDCELQEEEFVRTQIDDLLKVADSDTLKAGLYNQLNRFCYGIHQSLERNGTGDTEYLTEAISALKWATQLVPTDPSYFYNLAICLREQGHTAGAIEAIRTCLALDSNDEAHLSLAYRLFNANGMLEDAQNVRNTLRGINPRRAMLLT